MNALRLLTCLLICALVTGCGKSNFRTAVIVKPPHPVYDRMGCDRSPHATHCHYDLRRLLGEQVRVAERLAEYNGLEVRVVERDQTGLDRTTDFVSNRIDVATESRIVTEIRGIG